MQKNKLYKLIVSGLLVAVSIILSYVKIELTQSLRISFTYLPIMLAGALLGPGWGAAVGLLGDVLGFIIKPTGTYFPPIALTAMLAGAMPGLLFFYMRRLPLLAKTVLSVILVQVAGSLFLQSLWLSILYKTPYTVLVVARLPVALAMIPLLCIPLYVLLSALYKAKIDKKLS